MGVLKAKRDGKVVAYRLDKAAVIVGSGDTCNIRVADAGLVDYFLRKYSSAAHTHLTTWTVHASFT